MLRSRKCFLLQPITIAALNFCEDIGVNPQSDRAIRLLRTGWLLLYPYYSFASHIEGSPSRRRGGFCLGRDLVEIVSRIVSHKYVAGGIYVYFLILRALYTFAM